MKKDALGIWLVISILNMPSALALDINLEKSFGMVGRAIYDLLSREYVVFGIVIIVLIILFRSIFLAGLNKIPHFGQSGVSKKIATAFSLLCTLGIAYKKITSGTNVHGFLSDILGPAGIYAGIFLTLMCYLWLRSSMGKWALTGTGLVAYAVGSMISNQLMMSIGIIIFFISFIKSFGGRKYENYNGKNPKRGDGFWGTFKNKNKDKKQKDTATLLKRQIEDEEMELQVMRDLDSIDTKTIELRQIEQKIDSNLKTLLENEKAILMKDQAVEYWLLKVRKNIQWYETHSDPKNLEFIQKKNALKGRVLEYEQLHSNLMAKYQQIISSENEALSREQKNEEEEDKAEEKEVDFEQKAEEITEEMKKQQGEIIDDTTGSMKEREEVESKLVSRLKKVEDEQEKLLEEKQKITEANLKLSIGIKRANNLLTTYTPELKKLHIINLKNSLNSKIMENNRKKDAITYDITNNRAEQRKLLKKINSADKQDIKYEKKIIKSGPF